MGDKPDFNGKWLFHSQENFDAFLAENGVPFLIRKGVGLSRPTCEMSQNGDEFDIKLISMLQNKEDKFTVGTDYEQTQPNGAVFVASPRWDGNKLVVDFAPKEGHTGKKQSVTRSIDGDMLILDLEIGEVKAKRMFKKEAPPAAAASS